MKYLYTQPLPEASQPTASDSLGQQLAELGLLDGSGAAVESISQNPSDLTLEGQYRWGEAISEMVAAELDDLASSAIATLPLYRRDGRDPRQGYYEISSADVEPMHGNERSVWEYTLNLTSIGKRSSHYRSVATKTTQLDHPWGNDTTALIGIPETASKVRWFDSESGDHATADVVDTIATDGIDIDRYDVDDGVSALDTDTPELVYDVDYDSDRRATVRAYDTRGNGSKTDADSVRQWQLVHDTDHDIEDSLVVSTGALRLEADEDANTLTASEWDEDADDWSDVSLGDSDWELYEWDLRSLSPARIVSIVEFRDPTTSSYYTLRAIVHRGSQTIQFDRSGLEDSAVPDGLVDLLDPIASTSIKDPGESQGLRKRSEVKG